MTHHASLTLSRSVFTAGHLTPEKVAAALADIQVHLEQQGRRAPRRVHIGDLDDFLALSAEWESTAELRHMLHKHKIVFLGFASDRLVRPKRATGVRPIVECLDRLLELVPNIPWPIEVGFAYLLLSGSRRGRRGAPPEARRFGSPEALRTAVENFRGGESVVWLAVVPPRPA